MELNFPEPHAAFGPELPRTMFEVGYFPPNTPPDVERLWITSITSSRHFDATKSMCNPSVSLDVGFLSWQRRRSIAEVRLQ